MQILYLNYIYLVNKPFSAGVSEDNAHGRLKDCPKNEHLADQKRSYEGNCEMLRTIFQPRALSSDTTGSRKGVYLIFYNPHNNFSTRTHIKLFHYILWIFSCFFVRNYQSWISGNFNCYLFPTESGFFTRLKFTEKKFLIYNLIGPQLCSKSSFSGK